MLVALESEEWLTPWPTVVGVTLACWRSPSSARNARLPSIARRRSTAAASSSATGIGAMEPSSRGAVVAI
jgi:hypothetical protein